MYYYKGYFSYITYVLECVRGRQSLFVRGTFGATRLGGDRRPFIPVILKPTWIFKDSHSKFLTAFMNVIEDTLLYNIFITISRVS